METDWILLSECRNPHLALAEALHDGRRVECRTSPVRWTNCLYRAWEYVADGRPWSHIRIERRPEQTEPGPCPVCGATYGSPLEGHGVLYRGPTSDGDMCSVECICGLRGPLSSDPDEAIELWNRLRLVD